MPKSCPPGIICIENVTLIILVVISSALLLYILYHPTQQEPTIININEERNDNILRNDVLMNPYSPPYKRNDFIRSVPTNPNIVRSSFSQIGFLKSNTHKELMLPFFGKVLYTNRNKWQYYTINDTGIKLPVSKSGRSCTSEYGCDEIHNNENVYVDGYDTTFKATIYETSSLQYIPYI
jgi:hypothetical protein